MSNPNSVTRRRGAIAYPVLLVALLLALLPIRATSAAPAASTLAVTVEIPAVEDAGAVETVPTFNGGGSPYFVLNNRAGNTFDYNFMLFDLSVLPADATIDSAVFRLQINASANPLAIELGRADGGWDEGTLRWNNKPAVTWSGITRSTAGVGAVEWPIKPLLAAWRDGTQPNYGIAVRGTTVGTGGVRADTREGAIAPRLVVTYTIPADAGPRPDLGDAPDSTNNTPGANMAAYAGVQASFPTVWQGTPNGQAAGPRHANQTMEGWLGDYLSREAEADGGPDQDGINNIVPAANDPDNDRGDDGWRNRNARFAGCQRTTLSVRVSKSPAATRNFMYLNVWFDGNRDGDWQDRSACQATETEPAQAGYEWIVQNYIVDMTSIPAGGWRDFPINTQKVANSTEGENHWIRFTLSDEPAVQPPAGAGGPDLPDGRGPHPANTPLGYQFGETEDIFQRPAPAGADGVLELQKRVVTAAEPTEWIDYVTYEIRLRHVGGSQPLQAQIRDELPYPLIVYPTIDADGIHYVTVESPTDGAAPLLATLDVIPPQGGNPPQQVVNWEGAIAPDAEVVLSFQVRVLALCEANQQTMTFTNTAQARTPGGPILSAADDFTAKCIGYDADNVGFDVEQTTAVLGLDALQRVPVTMTITNSHPVSVSLGLFQLAGSDAKEAAAANAPRFLERVTLAPQAAATLDLVLRMETKFTDELMLPDDYTPSVRIAFCILPGADNFCPDAQVYPQLNGELPPILVPLRPHDLGDAPDSTNHAAAGMLAYPGVPARYPTVFDVATGMPEGPLHRFPRPFHLGKGVSLENEADSGPDQDPLNNIEPAANDPDNDRRDDGTNLALWNLANCQTTNLPVQVFISPAAVNYFQQRGAPGYLNIWLDGNRDGDWEDATQCGAQPAVEHIVIDQPVNVAALGAGLHLLNVPTGLVPWAGANQPAWVRITLSERPSNKTLLAGALSYGDGRGYPVPFKTGETEDYLYWPAGADGAGPDMAVYLAAHSARDIGQDATRAADKYANQEVSYFKIDYANVGSTAAQNALLEFQIPERLHGTQPAILRAPGVASQSISFNFDKVTLALPELAPGRGGAVVLGWYGCLTCTKASLVETPLEAIVSVQVTGDVDASNNQGSVRVAAPRLAPTIGAFMDYTDDALMDRTITGFAATCRAQQTLRGHAEPNSIIAILIGLQEVGTTTSDASGAFSYAQNLAAGFHRIQAENLDQGKASGFLDASSPKLALLVDPSLPFDPMSVTFTDSQGRTIAAPAFGWSRGSAAVDLKLRSGETYTMGVDSCGGSANRSFKVTFEDVLISSLQDFDGDGRYTGVFTYNPGARSEDAAAGELQLIAGDGSTQQRFGAGLEPLPTAAIRRQTDGQPIAGAAVAALVQQSVENAASAFDLVAASVLGQANPAATGVDGSYGFVAPDGTYRLDVAAAGYQPYRSPNVAVADGTLAVDLALTPAVGEAATHTVYVTDNGFDPPVLTVQPGSVVEWINVDLGEHGTRRDGLWDSGVLGTGASFTVKFDATGAFVYRDVSVPGSEGVIVVENSPAAVTSIFLPVVTR